MKKGKTKKVKRAKLIKKRKNLNRISNNKVVRKDMSFGEIMQKYPEAAEVLFNEGMHCLGCSAASFETLEQGALMHGINPEKLVERINKKINRKNKQ